MVDLLGKKYGEKQNMVRAGLEMRRFVRATAEGKPSPELAVVKNYDAGEGRVEIVFKDRPDALPLKNIPLLSHGIHKPIHTIDDDGEKVATVGILMPLLSVGVRSFDRNEPEAPPVKPLVPLWGFLPGVPTKSEGMPAIFDKNATPAQLDKFAPSDTFIEGPMGNYFLWKSDGTLVIKAKAIYLLPEGKAVADAKASARFDDAINDTTDKISAGSTGVFVG